MQILIYSLCIKVFFICKKNINESKVSSVLFFSLVFVLECLIYLTFLYYLK